MRFLMTLVLSLMCFTSLLPAAEINKEAICKVVAANTSDANNIKLKGGTGFVYGQDDENYYVLTNGHNIHQTNDVKLSLYKEDYMTSLIDTTVVSQNFKDGTSLDVAVLKFRKVDIPYTIKPLAMYVGDPLSVGTLVYGSGYPQATWQQSWSSHVIDTNHKDYNTVTIVGIGAVPGQSGSPVCVDIDAESYVVGMVTYRFGKGIKPTETVGGYLNADFIYDVLRGETGGYDKIHFDAVLQPTSVDKASTENNDVVGYLKDKYVIVDRFNEIVSYKKNRDSHGQLVPEYYTWEQCTKIKLREGDAFCLASTHPVCKKRYPILDRLPTLNRPKLPLLPPFGEPKEGSQKKQPDTQQNKAPTSPLWPQGSPFESTKKRTMPTTVEGINKRLKEIEQRLKYVRSERDKIRDKSLEPQKEVWNKKESELIKEQSELKVKLKELENPPKDKPVEDKPDTGNSDKGGWFKNMFSNVVGLPSRLLNMAGSVNNDGLLWTLLITGAGLAVPGVRGFLVAKGVSPIAVKALEFLAKRGISKVKDRVTDGKEEAGAITTPPDKPANVVNSVPKGESDVQTVGYNVSDYQNVQVVDTGIGDITLPESEKKPEETVNADVKTDYSNTMKEVVDSIPKSKPYITQHIKEFIDMRVSNGESLKMMTWKGYLYQEAVKCLGRGELKTAKGVPVQGYKSISESIESWVKTEYVSKINIQDSQDPYAEDYLMAYTGWLYEEAVKLLSRDEFKVLNYKEAYQAIETWVRDRLYEELAVKRNFAKGS